MNAVIADIEYYTPTTALTNEQLASDFPDWSVDKIFDKTGIKSRYICKENEYCSDLAVHAAKLILNKPFVDQNEIDYIILCTQSPDYKLPTTACIVQSKLGLSSSIGAVDINQGCSGFVYGLGLAKGLVETGQCNNVLLITSETYSKYINPKDKSVRTLFGDAATATLISSSHDESNHIGPFIYGTDGKGYDKLIVPHGGSRSPISSDSFVEYIDGSGNIRSPSNLFMNGADVFAFTLSCVKKELSKLLIKSDLEMDDIDHVVFHQPNKFMLDKLRRVCNIPQDKFHVSYEDFGNTVSCTIPIGLKLLMNQSMLKSGEKVLIMGFGVGYSVAGSIITWK